MQAGDYIIPSGLNDGTGIAVPADKLTPANFALIVGRAWETSEEKDIKRINTVVGLPSGYPQMAEVLDKLQTQQSEIEALKAELKSLKELLLQRV